MAASLTEIAAAMAGHRGNDSTRWRLFFESLRGADEAGAAAPPLPSARTEAALWAPASFRRRAIFLDRPDLTDHHRRA